jgi:acyl-CoA thioesterase-1
MNTRDILSTWHALLASAAAASLAACEAAPPPETAAAEAQSGASTAAPAPSSAPAPVTAERPATPLPPNAEPAVVTVLGDSITAGYGLSANQALPVQLESVLRTQGTPVRVRGAGVSGDTTGGGLARVEFSVRPDTDVAVVALGGNDLLQGIDPARTRANLDAIISKLKARGITVVLAGMQAPPQLGTYAQEFNALYPELARKHDVALYPFLLQGVALMRQYNQQDGIHPNAEGARIIAAGLAPTVAKAVEAHAARG